MTAYVIVDITIHDKEKYAEYVKQSPATVEAFGGRFVVRRAKVEVLEGDWTPGRFVMLEFDSVERAKEVRFFWHPFLRTGLTPKTKESFERFLAQRRYEALSN